MAYPWGPSCVACITLPTLACPANSQYSKKPLAKSSTVSNLAGNFTHEASCCATPHPTALHPISTSPFEDCPPASLLTSITTPPPCLPPSIYHNTPPPPRLLPHRSHSDPGPCLPPPPPLAPASPTVTLGPVCHQPPPPSPAPTPRGAQAMQPGAHLYQCSSRGHHTLMRAPTAACFKMAIWAPECPAAAAAAALLVRHLL